MGLILTKPTRIGDEMRMPGYELTAADIQGRNIDQMDRLGYVTYVDDSPRSRRGRRRAADTDDE